MSIFSNEPEAEPVLIQACWLAYDLPENADISDEPCDVLRPIAFHCQLSGWIIQEADIPLMYVDELRRAGATVDIFRFDASEAPKILRKACQAVEADVKKVIAEGRANCNRAIVRLNDDENAERALKRFKADQTRITKTMGRKLKDLKACAERFNISGRVPSLATCVSASSAIRTLLLQRAKAYAEAVAELEAQEGATDSVVMTAKKSRIPGDILADYLDDKGLDGAKLRSKYF